MIKLANILAVDDEPAILKMIQRILSKDGHRVEMLSNPANINRIKFELFDLIILDVMMPQTDGFALCRNIRDRVDCPIIFLTAKADESSLVYGLGIGADDYICKPFGALELRARINAHLRREHREHFVRLSFVNAEFNLMAKQLTVNQKEVSLTKGEYQICEFLARNQGAGIFQGTDI